MDPLIQDVFSLNTEIFPLLVLMEEIGSLSYYHVLYISGGDRRISEPSTV